MQEANDWSRIRELGAGGQSTVYLVRNPERTGEITRAQTVVQQSLNALGRADSFIEAVKALVRDDRTAELGALKLFDKTRSASATPEDRITREIEILQQGHVGLPKLLASNAGELWMITEFFQKGTLEHNLELFKGNALASLQAFRHLVSTIAGLHAAGVVHRDIKPANVFVSSDLQLVPGDFGIAYTQAGHDRLTGTGERVGPRDYMPQWGDMGERLNEVSRAFDVYMLGKLLWCMASGSLRLPREYHRVDRFNLEENFSDRHGMAVINHVLDKCVVEHERDCLSSATALLSIVDRAIMFLQNNWSYDSNRNPVFTCLNCRSGTYQLPPGGEKFYIQHEDSAGRTLGGLRVKMYVCDICKHQAFFSPENSVVSSIFELRDI